jgi:hypothetical protein
VSTHLACVLIVPFFKAGDPPPEGYMEWHEWARVQHRAGLRQRRCWSCGLWRFPQEKCHGPRPAKDAGFTVDELMERCAPGHGCAGVKR